MSPRDFASSRGVQVSGDLVPEWLLRSDTVKQEWSPTAKLWIYWFVSTNTWSRGLDQDGNNKIPDQP